MEAIMPKRQHSTKVPKSMQPYYQSVTELTDNFCQKQLNTDYHVLARYATAALCRKKPSPLISGKSKTWAAAVIHALGTINFLFDKSHEPYISAADLAAAFSLSTSTVANKAKQIRDMLKMHRFDHYWCLPSQIKNASFAWMITFNDFIVDARTLPRDVQEIACEKGLIPYVYTDKC